MNITFAGAVKSGLKNYSNFKGTATRAEFWYFYLFGILLNIVLSTIDSLVAPQSGATTALTGAGPLYTFVNIAMVIPNLSIAVRRFHDSGFSAKWLALWAIPAVIFFVTGGVALATGLKLTAQSTDAEFMAAMAVFMPTVLAAIGVGIFQLVVELRKSKSFEDGNKYAQPTVEDIGAGDEG